MSSSIAPEHIPPKVRSLCAELQRRGHRSWVVGGCLRDLLRGHPAADWDIATSARPDEVLQTFRRVIPTGIQHGTVKVIWKGQPFEVTTLRGEGAYSDGRRPDSVEFVDDIEADLARRDFTVNAMAYDPLSGVLVDPFDGLRDLEQGVLRAVGDPHARFSEDGLRVLRAARFVAKLQCRLDPATEAAIAPTLDTFRQVSAERVRDEWVKALEAPRPSPAFDVMQRTGILEITSPRLASLPQQAWAAALRAVDGDGDPIWRLAALHHPLATAALDEVADWLRAYRFSNAEQRRTLALLSEHEIDDHAGDADVRRLAARLGRDRLDDVLSLHSWLAEVRHGRGSPAHEAARALRARAAGLVTPDTPLTTKELAVDGKALMAALDLRPGPELGRLLGYLLERVLDEPSLNERARLLQLAKERIEP